MVKRTRTKESPGPCLFTSANGQGRGHMIDRIRSCDTMRSWSDTMRSWTRVCVIPCVHGEIPCVHRVCVIPCVHGVIPCAHEVCVIPCVHGVIPCVHEMIPCVHGVCVIPCVHGVTHENGPALLYKGASTNNTRIEYNHLTSAKRREELMCYLLCTIILK